MGFKDWSSKGEGVGAEPRTIQLAFFGCDSEEDGMTAGILWVTASVDD